MIGKMLAETLSKYSCLLLISLLIICGSANAQIKLSYKNYMVPPNIIYSYQGANGGVAVPASGAAQTWDYSALVKTPVTISETYISESNPFFSTARRQRILNSYFGGGFYANVFEHSNSNNAAYTVIGLTSNRSAFSLGSITGNANDSLILLAQNINYNGNKLALPFSCMYLSNWLHTYNYEINLQISLASQGLNHAPLKFTTSVVTNCDVTGWGDMRVPTNNGPGNYTPCLLLKTTRTQVDSFMVNGTPAGAAVLNVLGFTQGQITNQYQYHFKRAGLEQDLITFYFTNSSFNMVDRVIFDRTHYDLYCNNDNCHAKMCLNGINTVCLPYSNNAANNAMLVNGARLGECEATRMIDNFITNEGVGAMLYPNPSNNLFTLLLNDNGESAANVSVYDCSGRKIKNFEAVNGIVEFGNDLQPGIYFTRIESGLQKQMIKLIKSE